MQSTLKPPYLYVLLSFFSMTQSRVTSEEATSIEEQPPADWPVGVSVGIILTDD